MIVRKCLTVTVGIWLVLLAKLDVVRAERWSRQVSNSEWIPLANPRATQTQVNQNNQAGELLPSGPSQLPLSLPPAIQQQYQQQLLQLQKTQESIQKLLLLQQQLRLQQQLLQSQAFLPSGFSNPEDDKQLRQSALASSQTVPELAPEVLVPPLPSPEALPPVFPPQNFLPQRPRAHQPPKQNANVPQDFGNLSNQDYENGQVLQQGQNTEVPIVESAQDNQREGPKQLKELSQSNLSPQGSILPGNAQNEEEEVQLVYVPAETLAQRGQPKRGRGRKQYPFRQQQQPQHQHQQQQQHQHQQQQHQLQHQQQQQNENQGVVEPSSIGNDQDAFARQLLQHIQMEHEEKAQFLKDERIKEIARLNEEQKALERKARLQQEAVQREQELQRQREAEKKKKELERLEEMARQRELEKIREAREKQRMEELERRRLAEARAKEERRKEEEARQREADRLALQRQKDLEIQRALKQQRILDKQREDEIRATGPTANDNHEIPAEALPLIRDSQLHRQHLTETSRPLKAKVRGRQRQRNQYQDQQTYREQTTTPSPNQPPLSVYMGSISAKTATVRISDVLKILKDAKTIAVLDTVGPDSPQVFVGPTSLDPPNGYAKFDLPYLSSIDHNRVERKVDKLPFFVAPLSFDPPPGYSKIPFPAPHIGSVVVNTLDNSEPRESDDPNPSPTPLIEPNSYIDGLENGPDSTTPSYDSQTTIYSQDSPSTTKYETTYSTSPQSGLSGSRFRFRQFYTDNKPASVISTSYYEDQRPITRKQHKYYEENSRLTTESTLQSPRVETSVDQADDISYSSTPSFKESLTSPQDQTKEQDLAAQLALINQELNQQRQSQRYNIGEQYQHQNSRATTALSNTFDGVTSVGDINDVRAPVGPTQYNLPAELPAISPHLPGLVNSLLDKQEAKLQAANAATTTTTTTSTTTTTTTTTPRTPTTTYRPRSRQRSRVVSTRPRTTTQASSTRTNPDRSRRPYNRSRSRFTTTTEEYRESSYEPSKARIPETTLRHSNVEHRRPTSRNHKYRNRDKSTHQSEAIEQSQNVQSQQAYENIPPTAVGSAAASEAFLQPTGPENGLRQQDSIPPSTNSNDFLQENYPPTTIRPTENYPPLRDVTGNHDAPLLSNDYSRNQNYPPSSPSEVRYQGNFDQTTLEQTGLEKSPVNGFNYQAQNEETLEQAILQRPKEYPRLDGKGENNDFDLPSTEDPRIRTTQQHRYSSIYDVNAPQTQPEYGITGQSNFHRLPGEKIQTGVVDNDPNEPPIFIPLPQSKQEDYELQIPSTEATVPDTTAETTTVSTTPVVIRQRVRGRVGSRVHHHEPTIQMRPRGSQDEYVRFNVVNHEPTRSSSSRHRSRPRSRTQTHGSQVQTDGNEYIKIHVGQQQKTVTTTPPTTTTTTTTTSRPAEEDLDYGFIRAPNFRPVHPVDNRYQAPVTFRPPLPEIPSQPLLPTDEVELTAPQLLRNRPKYQPTPNRRLPGKATTLPPPTSTVEIATSTERIPVATALPDDTLYTVKPKSRPDELKQTRIRGRVRRPGKKRVSTTSTTESVLETHNELPLDENYPRINPQLPPVEQQTLYEESYDNASPFSAVRNQAAHQFYQQTTENYPQEFVLNFGNLPDQFPQREEYDQTQLASTSSRKYSHSTRIKSPSSSSQSTAADIYGAESQWSTKLSSSSFQPSFAANRVPGENLKNRDWTHENDRGKDVPEIITAAPEVSSITFVVSSDVKGNVETMDEESMLMGTTVFGKKTNLLDHTEKLNETSPVTGSPSAITQEANGNDTETMYDAKTWLMDRAENSTEQQTTIDFEKTTKKSAEPPVVRKGTRRRKVRVRVRPAVDDFVTAESQHFNSAINSLIQDQYKYNPMKETKITTEEPVTGSPQKSILQDLLTEILKEEVPVSARSTSTESPEDTWTMSTAMTTPMVIPGDFEETTLKENQITTTATTLDKANERVTTVMRPLNHEFVAQLEKSHDPMKQNEDIWGRKKTKDVKKEEKSQSRRKEIMDETDFRGKMDLEPYSEKYTREQDADKLNETEEGIQSTEKLDLTTKQLILSDSENEMETFSKISAERENTSDDDENKSENKSEKHENYSHPKNHRTKWSEVRYPSAFDHSQVSAWTYDTKANLKSTTSDFGLITKDKANDSVKTISDYVKAIFDTMKSVEEESTASITEQPDGEITTTNVSSETKSQLTDIKKDDPIVDDNTETTTQILFETMQPTGNVKGEKEDVSMITESTLKSDTDSTTTLERITTNSPPEIVTSLPVSDEPSITDSPTTATARITNSPARNSTESMLGKVLRTSTTTKVSHMTEICYRGRCVMTRPKRDDRLR